MLPTAPLNLAPGIAPLKRLSSLSLLMLLITPAIFAQTEPFLCATSAGTPGLIRADGSAERVNDVVLTCTGGSAGASGAANFTISFPANATSRIVAPATSGSEALLLIDEPQNPTPGTNLFQGTAANNQITFVNIPIVPPVNGQRIFRFTNLRINAAALGQGAHLVQAAISISGTTPVPINNPVLAVAVPVPSVRFDLADAQGNAAQDIMISAGSLNAPLAASQTATGGMLTHRLSFTEGFQQSFRKRNAATLVSAPQALSDQAIPGSDYHTESGFYVSTLPSTNGLNTAGLATQGTRLMVRFNNVPPGVALYVTTTALPGSGATSAELVSGTDAAGNGSFVAAPPTTTVDAGGTAVAVAPVSISNGSGTAVWEVLDADPASLESYTFGLVVAYGSAYPATIAVTGGLGPVSNVVAADASAPVPRFFSPASSDSYVSLAASGSLGCTTSPCLTALPTGISLSYQTATADPSPITLQLGDLGGPLAFNASISATQAGWMWLSADSGTTPATLQVNFTPGNLTPGVYQASIELSSPASAFSTVTVPVILTVTIGPLGFIPFGCNAAVSVPLQMRQGGLAENAGVLIMNCTNGTPTAAGAPVRAYDLHLTLPTPITSRTYANGWSEVLLIFDAPNGGLPWSVNALQACSDPSGTCVVMGTGNGVGTYDASAGHPNVFPGRISGNTVTFPGVPIDPLGGIFHPRIMQIVNLRTDISSQAVDTSLTGTVSAGTLAISNPTQVFGFVSQAASFSTHTPDNAALSNGTTVTQCTAATPQRAGILRFTEGFGTAFRPRTAATYVDTETSPVPVTQNVPGAIYNTETGFYDPSVTSPLVDFITVGLANFATRLRAQIANLPNGTRIFVSTVPVVFTNGVPAVSTGSIARLVQDEIAGFAPAAATTTLDGIPAAELTVNGGAASAVWEVLTTNPNIVENLDFAFWVQAGSTSVSPAIVTASLAPAPPAFSDSGSHSASSTLPVPRFSATGTSQPLVSVASCGPLLSISKAHNGNFAQGQRGVTYTITVSNAAAAQPTSGTVTVAETIPSGMTLVSMAGTGWSCPPGGNTCTRNDVLAAGAAYPAITVTVDVAPTAPSPLINNVTVSGGGSVSTTVGDSTLVIQGAVLQISQIHSDPFAQGQANATYTVTVTNVGGGLTSGLVTVTENVPAGMTLVSMAGTGWTCPAGGTTCTWTSPLYPGWATQPLTLTMNVAANAPASVTNQVTASGGGSPDYTASDLTTITPLSLRFVPLTPCRVADTRNPDGAFGGPPISGGTSRDFGIANSTCGVPANALAYSLNVAVVPSGPLGYLTLWPSGQTRPLASTLNSLDGRVKSNAAIVPAGTGRAISVFASNPTHVVLDINGYFVPATDPTALAFYPITPCRIADTRKATGSLGGPSLAGGQSRTFPVPASTCNIPASAQAYSLNLAAVPNGPLGYVTAWASGQSKPVVASLNALTGAITANAAIVPAGANGNIDIFASDNTDLVIDINGYFAPMAAGGLSLYSLTPCRVLDTRKPVGAQPFWGKLDVDVAGSLCGIPPGAQAHVFSATVVPATTLGYLTLWPQAQTQPVVATLNALDGAITSNMAIVPTTNGSISAWATNPTQLVLDVSGYFAQ